MVLVSGGHVLVVDDDPLLRTSVGRVLEEEGYAVDFAGDGEEALGKIAGERPDVILLDVLMPGMNGRQVLESLHQDPTTSDIPVLVMTAVHGIDPNQAIGLGASDLVEKPFDIEELLNKVALALYRRSHSQPRRPPAIDAGADGSTGVILVVDGDRLALTSFDRLLSARGYTVVSLSRVTEDLPRLARVLEPRAVLIDLRLPNTDGLTALRWLRSDAALDAVPILVFSEDPHELEQNRSEIESLSAALLSKSEAIGAVIDFVTDPPTRSRRAAG